MEKIKYFILFLLFTLACSIYSQEEEKTEHAKPDSQSDRRMSRKWILKVSPNQFGGTNGRKSLSFQYNWKGYLSLGLNYMHFTEKTISKNVFPDLREAQNREKNNNQYFLHSFIKYYPFSSFFHLSYGFGRNSGNTKESLTMINLNRNSTINSITMHSQDLSPYYYNFLGFGFEWLFSNGFFLGLDMSRTFPINRKYNSQYTIIPISRTSYTVSDLQNIFLYNRIGSGNSKNLNSQDLDGVFINLWIGYAF